MNPLSINVVTVKFLTKYLGVLYTGHSLRLNVSNVLATGFRKLNAFP